MSKLTPLGSGIIPTLLSGIYYCIISIRNLWYDTFSQAARKTGRYTVSIGSIRAGGTGKTPLTLLVGTYFCQMGYETIFLSRGYGRQSSRNTIARPGEKVCWKEVGDEPAMLHNALTGSWLGIGSKRGGIAALITKEVKNKAVFILDDGFQHRSVHRHKNIVCLSTETLTDTLIPAGYLREPVSALKRADMICLIGSHTETQALKNQQTLLSERLKTEKIVILYQSADQWVNTKTGRQTQKLPCKNPLLISGIARPDRFINMVRELSVTPYNSVCYEDHHIFESNEISELCTPTTDGIITTEKDAIRLSTIKLDNCPNIWYLKINLSFIDDKNTNLFFNSLL